MSQQPLSFTFLPNEEGAEPLTKSQKKKLKELHAKIAELENSEDYFPESPDLIEAFLHGRKWKVDRALQTLTNFIQLEKKSGPFTLEGCLDRYEEGVMLIPHEARDNEGRQIIYLTPRNQKPGAEEDIEAQIRLTMYTLLRAIRSKKTLQNGVIMILDFNKAPFRPPNQKMKELFDALNEGFPVRFGRQLMCDPPWFFSIVWSVFKYFMSEKIRSRVQLTTTPELKKYAPESSLPTWLGGTHDYDHIEVVREVYKENGIDRTLPAPGERKRDGGKKSESDLAKEAKVEKKMEKKEYKALQKELKAERKALKKEEKLSQKSSKKGDDEITIVE
mmetsp:Transcript_21409/g.23916  ORF Transcript_21409/g.23916 Transcript_21409/m.23916 type:complete len:332 (+) Transcript_21409:1-996(+)